MRVSWTRGPLEAFASPRGPTRARLGSEPDLRDLPRRDPLNLKSLRRAPGRGGRRFLHLEPTRLRAHGGKGPSGPSRGGRGRCGPAPLIASSACPSGHLRPVRHSDPHVPLSSRSTPPLRGTGPSAAHRAPQGSRPRARARGHRGGCASTTPGRAAGQNCICSARRAAGLASPRQLHQGGCASTTRRRTAGHKTPACLPPASPEFSRPPAWPPNSASCSQRTLGAPRPASGLQRPSRRPPRLASGLQRPSRRPPPQAAGPSAPAWTGRGDLAPLSTSSPSRPSCSR